MKNVMFRIDNEEDFIIIFLDSEKNGMFEAISLADGLTNVQREWIKKYTKNVISIPQSLLDSLDNDYTLVKRLPTKKLEIFLYDNNRYHFDDVKEMLNEERGEDEEISDSLVYDVISCFNQDDYDMMMDTLKELTNQTTYHVIYGSLGTWRGRFNIYPQVDIHLDSLVKKAMSNCDCSVKLVDGKIEITSHHHDGTNYYTIQPLNRKGEQRYDDGKISEDDDFKKYVKKYNIKHLSTI